MSDIAVRVKGLGKQFRIGQRENYRTLRDVLARAVSNPARSAVSRLGGKAGAAQPGAAKPLIWALKDVSFEVKRGEVMGIIGPNGAGKSTLLKILSRITAPTQGRIEIHGRLASLLEVGTGFHPELSGRENIYLNGAILGMKRTEIEKKFDEIVSFAEVEKFMDTPVKHYSSGMYLRLAFAVAAHLEPEILLVDEVLAVGDAAFQKKCLGKMGEVASSGRTVLFVSHNMAAVQQLTRTSILLDHGTVTAQGPSMEVIQKYLDTVTNRSSNVYNLEGAPRRYSELRQEVEFLRVELEEYPNRLVPADGDLCLDLTVRGNEAVNDFRFSITIFQIDGTPVGNVFGPGIHSIGKGETATYRMKLSDLRLARGRYYCALAVGKGNHMEDRAEYDIILDVLYFEVMGPLRADGVMSEWFTVWGPIRFDEPQVERIA
ncbi:MAG TPA: ABC transporter ATP-binding protein [Anaerolineaceae bacterium]